METGIPTLDQVRAAAPAELAVVLSTVDADLVAGLDAGSMEALVVATQKVASWCHGLQAVAVDRFAELTADALEAHVVELAADRGVPAARVVGVPEPDAVAASSLAPLLTIAPRTMRARLNRARALMELPATLGHALAGRLEPWRVDAVVTAARDVAADRVVEFEARLYATDVTALPRPRLAERARRAAVKADPESVRRAHEHAPRRWSLRWAPGELPGLMRWTLDVPDEVSRRLAGAVDALAGEYLAADASAAGRSGPGRRTVEAARLDALTDLALAQAEVTTVVELVVPAAAVGRGTLVHRPDRGSVIRDALSRTRPGGGGGPGGQPPDDRDGPAPPDQAPHRGDIGSPDLVPLDPVPVPSVTVDAVDPVLLDLVAGSVTHHTLGCGSLERDLGMLYGLHLETAGNPFLTTRAPGPPRPAGVPTGVEEAPPVWFVDGLVQAPGAGALLPAQVVALLDHPDTRLRVSAVGRTPDDPRDPTDPVAPDTPRRRTYRPGRSLAAQVRARDGHCRFPGCSVPAARCDLDHLTPHPEGDTCEENLHTLCRAHHGFKHHAGWRVRMDPDGTCHWTAPTGRTHTTHPASRRDTAA